MKGTKKKNVPSLGVQNRIKQKQKKKNFKLKFGEYKFQRKLENINLEMKKLKKDFIGSNSFNDGIVFWQDSHNKVES